MNWRSKIEALLEIMGGKITIHPKKIILILLALSFVLISNVPQITIYNIF